MAVLIVRSPYPIPEETADTTRIKADTSRVFENAPSGVRSYFVALNASLHTELARRGLA
jgi:hypothetical protein